MHVPLFTKQYNLVPVVKGWWCSAAGEITVGLASHWPCVTDSSGLSTYGLNGQHMGDEHPAYSPDGARPGLPLTDCTLEQQSTLKVQVKVGPCYAVSHESNLRSKVLYNIRSGSWLARANDTAVHYAAIHWLHQRTMQPLFAASRHTTAQSVAQGLHPIARKLPLISCPAEGRRLSWPECKAEITHLGLCIRGSRSNVKKLVFVLSYGSQPWVPRTPLSVTTTYTVYRVGQ